MSQQTTTAGLSRKIMLLDSAARDTSSYPTSNRFRLNFDAVRGIRSVRLLDAQYPLNTDGLDTRYALLAFDEFSLLETTYNNGVASAAFGTFARLPIAGYDIMREPFVCYLDGSRYSYLQLAGPTFAQLTMSLIRPDGTPFYSGTETWDTNWSVTLEFLYTNQ